jgi:hypothetical protein
MRLSGLLALLIGLLVTGCGTTTLTNLTPNESVRNQNGLYPFELLWNSKQASIRQQTIHPSVVIGFDTYPMRPVSMMSNRWETLVPISTTNSVVNYRFKVDYEYNSIPTPSKTSKLSSPYQIRISPAK